MNICIVSDDFLPSATGVGIHLKIVTQRLVSLGHKVVVITSRQPGQNKTELWNGVKIIRLYSLNTFGFWQALATPATIKKILVDEKIELVHHHYLSGLMFSAYKAAHSLKIKQMLTFHMGAEHVTQPVFMRPLRPLVQKLYMWFCRQMSLILVPATGLIEFLRQNNVQTTIEYLSNPVDLPKIEFNLQSNSKSKEGQFHILYVGRLNKEKNVQFLIQSFNELQKKYPQSRLKIAGKGDQKEALEKLSSRLGIQAKVEFLGFLDQSQLALQYQLCDVFVLPSVYETQGLVVMEAMLYSKPVIVTNKIVSALDLVEPEVNGYIVKHDSTTELATQLEKLLLSPELRKQMGVQGNLKTIQYKPDYIVNRLVSYYENVYSLNNESKNININSQFKCKVCDKNSVNPERAQVMGTTREVMNEKFSVWKCEYCDSINSLGSLDFERVYKNYPIQEQKYDFFAKAIFSKRLSLLTKAGVTRTQSILDYGCGSGLFVKYLNEQGYQCAGFDPYSSSYNNPKVLESKYDYILCQDVLEHIDAPIDFLKQIKTHLNSGGRLVIGTPFADNINIHSPVDQVGVLHQPFHRFVISRKGVKQLFHKAMLTVDLTLEKNYVDTFIPFINSSFLYRLFKSGGGVMNAGFEPIKAKQWIKNPDLIFWGLFGRIFARNQNIVIFATDVTKVKSNIKTNKVSRNNSSLNAGDTRV